MFIAKINSEHFEFLGAGQSQSQARRCVVDAFERHLKQHDSSRQQWCEGVGHGYTADRFAACLEDWYGINVVELHPGVALRDGSVI